MNILSLKKKNALLGLGGIKPTTNRMVVLYGSLMCGALTTELLVFQSQQIALFQILYMYDTLPRNYELILLILKVQLLE